MRSHALILALFVFHAQAATIPDKDAEFEKKLTDVVKEVLDKEQIPTENVSSEQELIDQANIVKDVQNNLRNGVQVADIPVKVVIEEVKPALKSDCEKEVNNEVASENEDNNIKRVEIDLKNPGEPQRQEHDNQNPERFSDGQEGLAAVKQHVINSQSVFSNSIQGIQQDIQSWWAKNDQFNQIQEGIKNLQASFQNQINTLNETVQKIWQPNHASVESSIKPNVASSQQLLESDGKSGVKALSQGVDTLASLREENKNETQSSTNPIQQFFQNMAQQFQQQFQNITNNIQSTYGNWSQNNNSNSTTITNGGGWQGVNIFNGFNRPPVTNQTTTVTQSQADEGAAAPSPGGLWTTFQNNLQSIFQPPGQNVQSDAPVSQPAPNRPVLNAIQQIPLFQGVANFINPQPKPSQSTQAPELKPEDPKPEASQEGSNVVPTESKPDKEQEKEKPVLVQSTQSGPIKQLIEKNPFAQGIAGAVQRIQHTIINPEKPRDAVVEGEKGLLLEAGHGHGGPASGDNNDEHSSGSGVAVKSEPAVESVEVPKEAVKEEAQPSEVPDKTEQVVVSVI